MGGRCHQRRPATPPLPHQGNGAQNGQVADGGEEVVALGDRVVEVLEDADEGEPEKEGDDEGQDGVAESAWV